METETQLSVRVQADPVVAEVKKEGLPGLAVTAYLIVFLWGAYVAKPFLVPLCLSALLALMMAPFVRRLCKIGCPEWLAIGLSAIILVTPFVIGSVLLVQQVQSLVQDYPKLIVALEKYLTQFSQSSWGHRLHLSESLSLTALTEHLQQSAGEGLQLVLHSLRTILEAGTELVLILIFAFLMLASREHLYHSGEKILARFESIEAAKMLDAVTTLIERFLMTKLIVVAIITLGSYAALAAFGLSYSFLLAVIVGALTFIPEVGFVVSLVPIILVAFATGHSFLATAGMLGAMLLIHLIEANLLTPKLVGERLNLNVLTSFIGLFAGGLLWGVWGMLLCVPILGVLRIALSVSPELRPWADLLAEREDKILAVGLSRRTRFIPSVTHLLYRQRKSTDKKG